MSVSCLCNSELEKCFCLLMNVHQIQCLISDHVLCLNLQASFSKPSSYCTLGRITFKQCCLSGTLKLGTLLCSKPHKVSYSWSRRNSFTSSYLLNTDIYKNKSKQNFIHFTVSYCRFMFKAPPSLLLFSACVISACHFAAPNIPINPHSIQQQMQC
jgi:hypothetical protein